jgi:hypothetical protein
LKLQQVAQRTGGRVLQVGDPSVNLFLDQGLPVPESMRQAWDLCLELAAALFLLDVAVRRLAIEWPTHRAKEAPRDAARLTEAWRQARRSAQRGTPAAEVAGSAQAASVAPDGQTAAVQVDAASDATVATAEPVVQPPAHEPEDDSPMGRLRAAKRRARGGGDA